MLIFFYFLQLNHKSLKNKCLLIIIKRKVIIIQINKSRANIVEIAICKKLTLKTKIRNLLWQRTFCKYRWS